MAEKQQKPLTSGSQRLLLCMMVKKKGGISTGDRNSPLKLPNRIPPRTRQGGGKGVLLPQKNDIIITNKAKVVNLHIVQEEMQLFVVVNKCFA